MSQSSPRPRPQRSTAGTSVQSLGEGDRRPWHPKLESKSGRPEPRPEQPEFLRIRSTSHTGRLLRHHLHWVPWHCRPPLPKPSNEQRGIAQQEQLLYLALYRDKVAKQQAEIAQAAEAAASSSTGRRRGERAAAERAAAAASEPPAPNAGGGGPVASAAGAGATPLTAAAAGLSAGAGLQPEAAATAEAGAGATWLAEAPAQIGFGKLSPWQTEMDGEFGSEAAAETLPPGVFMPMSPEQRASPRDVGGEGGAQRARRTARSQQVAGRAPGRGEEEEEGRTSTHIASVSVRAAFGGVTSEHLESKHLGQLFDQWRARQAELNGGDDGSTAELLGRGHGALPSTPRRAAASAPSVTPSPRRCPAAVAAGNAMVQSSPRGGAGPAAGAGALAGGLRQAAAGSEPGRSKSKASVSTESKRKSKSPASANRSHTATTDPDESSAAGEDRGGTCHSSERRRMDRLFNVITNSKVRCESFAEKGISDLSARPAPSYIEGIPPLHLHHLHQGPWRLSV